MQGAPPRRSTAAGRPEATSPAAIERAAFGLFAARGFEGTTLQAIADAVGVSRRTLFRYYDSKNDIPWGQFERTLEGFRETLHASPPEAPLADAVHHAVVEFNRFPPEVLPTHRERMRLILGTPALQAHSVLKYAEWREVIAQYVGARLDVSPSGLRPQIAAQVSLALSLTAYDAWLADEFADLIELLDASMSELRGYLSP